MTSRETVNTDEEKSEVHWLFKPTDRGVSCLGIQVFPDGDYVVIDSPTGTYMAGHKDRGKWRQVHDEYVAHGFLPEAAAKATGLIPGSWSRQPPPPPWARRRRRARVLGVAALFAVVSALLWLAYAVLG